MCVSMCLRVYVCMYTYKVNIHASKSSFKMSHPHPIEGHQRRRQPYTIQVENTKSLSYLVTPLEKVLSSQAVHFIIVLL